MQFDFSLKPVDFVGQYQRGVTFKQELEREKERKRDRERTEQERERLKGLEEAARREDALVKDARQMKYLLEQGDFKRAQELAIGRLQALTNMGADTRDTEQVLGQLLGNDPKAALSSVNGFLSRYGEVDKAADSKSKGQTAQQKNFEQLQKLKNEGDEEGYNTFSKMLNLIEDKKLSSFAEKELAKLQDNYFDLKNSSNEFNLLANDIEKADLQGGYKEGFKEWFKKAIGSEDDASALRRKFRGLRASQVVKNLPPGAASDTDIKLALSGWPGDNADGETISKFLRGQAKLAELNANFSRFKAEYYSKKQNTQGFLKAWDSAKDDFDIAPNIGNKDEENEKEKRNLSGGFSARVIN